MTDWDKILAEDFAVPPGRAQAELAAELSAMLASTDPHIRDDTAYPVLAIWTGRGVFDGHLANLGDSLTAQSCRRCERSVTAATRWASTDEGKG